MGHTVQDDPKYCTWIPGGEVEVGEVDHVVVAILLLVEESHLGRATHDIISYHSLEYETCTVCTILEHILTVSKTNLLC